jgi:hypothetical protein
LFFVYHNWGRNIVWFSAQGFRIQLVL